LTTTHGYAGVIGYTQHRDIVPKSLYITPQLPTLKTPSSKHSRDHKPYPALPPHTSPSRELKSNPFFACVKVYLGLSERYLLYLLRYITRVAYMDVTTYNPDRPGRPQGRTEAPQGVGSPPEHEQILLEWWRRGRRLRRSEADVDGIMGVAITVIWC